MDTGEDSFGHGAGDWFDQSTKDSGGVFRAGEGVLDAEAG